MISEIIVTAVTNILTKFIEPRMSSLLEKADKSMTEKVEFVGHFAVKNAFKKFLCRKYEKYSIIDTLVFPNRQTLIKELYIPLTVESHIGHELVRFVIGNEGIDLLDKFHRVIIVDQAGMGKSTLSKILYLSIIDENNSIPVLIDLNKLNSSHTVFDEIKSQLSETGDEINLELLINLINYGDFTFILDGYDEIKISEKDFVTKNIEEFIERSSSNKFLMTSRPEKALASFGDFQGFNIKPLRRENAYSLIKNYDTYNSKKISSLLIKSIGEMSSGLEGFLENPLMISLLYKAFDYKKDIPFKKSQFYRQVYDALFEDHDLSKEGYYKREKKCALHSDEFERVVRHIAYKSSIKGEVEYNKEEILKYIENSLSYNNIKNVSASDYLDDLITSVPLFKSEKISFRWAHKSLQDFFSAKFIWIDSAQSRAKILNKIRDLNLIEEKSNILSIYLDLDPDTWRRAFLLPIAENILSHLDNFITKGIKVNGEELSEEVIKEIASGTFNRDIYMLVTDDGSKYIEYHEEFISYDFNELIKDNFEVIKGYSSNCLDNLPNDRGIENLLAATVISQINLEAEPIMRLFAAEIKNFYLPYELLKEKKEIVIPPGFPNELAIKIDLDTVNIDMPVDVFYFFYQHVFPRFKRWDFGKLQEFTESIKKDREKEDELLSGW